MSVVGRTQSAAIFSTLQEVTEHIKAKLILFTNKLHKPF